MNLPQGRLLRPELRDGVLQGYQIICPGCRDFHENKVGFHFIWTLPGPDHPHWEFDGNEECPTFSPSLLGEGKFWIAEEERWIDYVCHSYVRAGRIQYLGDCTHELAGQTVPMVPWEE